jgi:hypothetical protein
LYLGWQRENECNRDRHDDNKRCDKCVTAPSNNFFEGQLNLVPFANRLWLIGGRSKLDNQYLRDIWSSGDGVEWTKEAEIAEWKNAPSKMVASFQERIWLISGCQVWCSSTGITWSLVAEQAAWNYREGASLISFGEQLFFVGGYWPVPDGSRIVYFNDVWSSRDGKAWELVKPHSQWRERAFHSLAEFNDALVLLGGGRWETQETEKDVWGSGDGKEWSPLRSKLSFVSLSPSLVVYRGAQWMLGSSAPHQNKHNTRLVYSWDGKRWHEYRSKLYDYRPKSRWSGSANTLFVAFRDRMWAIGASGSNEATDVWSMALPGNWRGNWLRETFNSMLYGD